MKNKKSFKCHDIRIGVLYITSEHLNKELYCYVQRLIMQCPRFESTVPISFLFTSIIFFSKNTSLGCTHEANLQ